MEINRIEWINIATTLIFVFLNTLEQGNGMAAKWCLHVGTLCRSHALENSVTLRYDQNF